MLLLFSTMSFTSCEKFVDLDYPKTQLLDSLVFQDFGTAETALLQVYIDLRSSYLANNTGCNFQYYVDDMHCYSNDPSHGRYKFFNNLLAETDEAEIANHWDAPYSTIYKANKLACWIGKRRQTGHCFQKPTERRSIVSPGLVILATGQYI